MNIDSRAGFHELKTELLLLCQLRHSNLVPLIGYCLDHQQMILVYQFIFNGNLGEQLYGTNHDNPLPWKQRLWISIGVARVLHYLHTGLKHTIIYRNVKPSNILLDEKWEPKLADFVSYKMGLPSLSEALIRVDSSAYIGVSSTLEHLDPEYFVCGELIDKSDVYSFGLVLLQLLCGRKTLEQRHLLEWVRKCKRERTINEIVDPYLMGKIAPECFKKYVDIATSCVQKRGKNRPTIGEVEVILGHAMELQKSADAARKDVDPGGDHYNYPIVEYTCSASPPESETEESVPDSDITATIWEKF